MNNQTIPSLSKVINKAHMSRHSTITMDCNRHVHQEQTLQTKQTVKMKLTQTNDNEVPHPIICERVKELMLSQCGLVASKVASLQFFSMKN